MQFFDRLQQETTNERNALYSVPLISDAVQGKITRETYLAFLAQAYHHVKHAVPLTMLMASRLPKEKEWLRRELAKYIVDEMGHDDWVLGDIKNAGGDPEAVKTSNPELAVELMNAFNYDIIMRVNPIGYLGMIYVLENASTALATQAAETMQKSLGLTKECFSYLDSHGSLDIEHTKFIGNLLNQITELSDQQLIIHATKVIYHLYTDMFRNIPHSYAKKAA